MDIQAEYEHHLPQYRISRVGKTEKITETSLILLLIVS